MILNYIIIPFIKLIPVGIYLFFFFRRMFGFFGLKKDRKLTRIISIIIPATMVLYGINKWGFGHVLITHLTFFAVLFEIINIIVVHVLKKKSDKWKKIYSSGLIPILCLAVILGYGMYNMFNIVETDYTIYTDKNIRDEGYRVALISDLHYGTTIDGDRLTEICEDISERNVDIVALAGDIVDESTTEKEMKEAAEILGNIKSKYGIFYVFGNHDKNTYVRKQLYTVNELITTLENNEIQVLIDDAVEINDDMVVIGRDDGDNPESDQRASTSEIIKDIEKDKFLLMIDHKPTGLQENAEKKIDLQISGHTHGGQIWPNGILRELRNPNYIAYGHRDIEDMQIIVSSGIAGWGYPIKTGAPAEYVIIDILKR